MAEQPVNLPTDTVVALLAQFIEDEGFAKDLRRYLECEKEDAERQRLYEQTDDERLRG